MKFGGTSDEYAQAQRSHGTALGNAHHALRISKQTIVISVPGDAGYFAELRQETRSSSKIKHGLWKGLKR